MHVQPLLVEAIVVRGRMLPLREKVVDQLVESMREVGLVNPITIRWPSAGLAPVLVTGRCRLEAARRLGWETIPCLPVEADDTQALLLEIDENLARSVLTPAQRAKHIAGRKRVYELLHPETKAGGDRKSAAASKRQVGAVAFTEDTAAKTGRSRRSIERDAARAEAIPELDRVVDTSLDKGEELDALSRLPTDAQHALIERAAAGEPVSAQVIEWQTDEAWHHEHFRKCWREAVAAWEAWVAREPDPAAVRRELRETWAMLLQASGLEAVE